MSSVELSIVPLDRSHRAPIKQFRCGVDSLDLYLKRFAERHSLKDHISRTYLAIGVSTETGALHVAGYHSVSTCSLEHNLTREHDTLGKLPRFPIPGVLLARLAVAEQVGGQGLGRRLFAHALNLALDTSHTVAARIFVTDALSPQAVSFYQSMGMILLDEHGTAYPKRMVLDLEHLDAD